MRRGEEGKEERERKGGEGGREELMTKYTGALTYFNFDGTAPNSTN